MTTKDIVFALAATLCVASAHAQTPSQPGASFMKVFAGLCMRGIGDLEALRSELKTKGLPTLQEAAARVFLDGRPGDAWPVPEAGALGNLVLILPSDQYECSVLARRGAATPTQAEFSQLLTKPPVPFASELKTDERPSSALNGEIHTLGYLWKLDGNPKALAFMLTTSESPAASIQLKATATRVSAP